MGLHLSIILMVMTLAGNKCCCHSSKILHCVEEHISLVREPTIAPTWEYLSENHEEILIVLRFSKNSEERHFIPFCTVWHWPVNKEEKKNHYRVGIHGSSLVLGIVWSGISTEAAAALCPEVQPHQEQAHIPSRHILQNHRIGWVEKPHSPSFTHR